MDGDFTGFTRCSRLLVRAAAAVFCLLSAASFTSAQSDCITDERAKALLDEIRNVSLLRPDAQLKTDILKMRDELAARSAKPALARSRSVPKPDDMAARVCEIARTKQWPGKTAVGAEAASAWIKLVKLCLSIQDQRRLLPVISAGVENGEIAKDEELAAFLDRLRLQFGVPQIFGTQAAEQDGFLVLYPLRSGEQVDAWRKEYGMPPLREYLRLMQNFYRKLVIRSTARVRREPTAATVGPPAPAVSAPLDISSDDEVIRVETSLVTVDATVSGTTVPKLERDDFKIFEDGQPQEITSFSASEAPFDIVLLLDLSGSTANKVGLIKKTTRRFIELKRDTDRVAIVTFNGDQTVVSPLEADKVKLLDKISEIKGDGESRVWDSEKFAMDLLRRDSPASRRKAVVVITDGIDNDLFFTPGPGSGILFADLIEEIRSEQISFFPIYLDPGKQASGDSQLSDNARRTLQMLADESGGTFYTTANLEKLSDVYTRVMQDVGRVYTLGYQPKNDKQDGTWRSIRVELPDHPELTVRARRGYYAK